MLSKNITSIESFSHTSMALKYLSGVNGIYNINFKHIAIDEFAVKKGHRYMTMVVELYTGIIK
jgi:hypothetical protein